MKVCKKCGESFKVHVVIDGKERNLNTRKYCLNCSPFLQHNTRNIDKDIEGFKKCTKCGILKPINLFYKRRTKTSNNSQSYCMDCSNELNRERFKRNKQDAVDYKGGKCSICGYNKCVDALDFHHINPEEKDVDSRRIKGWSKEKRNKELDKCILVCSNCHREIHSINN